MQRLVNQCQRAGWIEVADYRTSDRKERERWAVTEQGRIFAGLTAPTAPTAPTSDVSAEGAKAQGGCAHRAHPLGGYGG